MRLAWFSPLPPSTSGIAAYSSEILPLLVARGCEIDAFDEQTAHEFVWRQRRCPYDLTIFQMGNASCHDYMWAYLFRYPGLVVLHDLQLHQARALFLTKRWEPRVADYIAEVHANQPDAPEHLPYLVLARMGDRMYQHWPLIRLVIEAVRDEDIGLIVTVGRENDPASLGPQPENVVVHRYIPQGALLPRCHAVITHGGAGTTLGALAFGLPLLVLPQGADQYANAERVVSAGAGRS